MLITVDGVYKLEVQNVGTSVIYVSGSLGGGTATLGYMAGSGFVGLTDGALAEDTQTEVRHGMGMKLVVQLVGSSTPSLEVMIRGIK